MKKITIYILFLSVLCSSCESFLDTKPTDFSTPETFYSTEDELNQALAGVYNALAQDGTYGRNLAVELAHSSDEGFYKRNTANINPAHYNHDAANTIVLAAWRTLYEGVNRANLLLKYIDRPEMDEDKREVIKGEALFLRSYFYFLLVSLWGDVPLILEPARDGNKVNTPKTPAEEIYEVILRDMEEALALVKKYSDIGFPGRVSKTAIQGILARVCLKMAGAPLYDLSKLESAKTWAGKVITSGEHELNTDYSQIFINHSADKYDTEYNECIWEVEFWGNRLGNSYQISGRVGNQFSIRSTTAEMYGYAMIGATATLYRKYDDPDDIRRDWNIAPFRYASNTSLEIVYHTEEQIYDRDTGKWRREYEEVVPRSVDFSPTNFPLLRYADVLLMYAEAENELNGPTSDAYDKLNEVRRRAGAYEFSGLDQDGFLQVIQDERARELCFEGLRKQDLIRWGVFQRVMRGVGNDIAGDAPSNLRYAALGYERAIADRQLFLPIPIAEMSLNKAIKQNEGW
ncbi:RagB/SusD family nutrient uptake outer membrane protein [Proteiniphilum sp. UBA5384]|uniref:RagB/SusD family nutrient uptake outer membrane protein n=1 Tax=Proteiniphilum sp. UBA5384 TaxID=1947279 RepID=UPI0025DA4261|nr:RagB/SusD family nutrient uptake outer membrane protein [Proteiniphilum sp. UBA5384]